MRAHAAAPWPQGEQLKFLLLPKDPLDEKNTMLEVRCSCLFDCAAICDAVLQCCAVAVMAELVRKA